MIEINGDDIKELSDADLRLLIGLLCEAELKSFGISPSGVTFGGNQDAADGGIDVRVHLSDTLLYKDGFIPRCEIGFQVKKPDMPRKSIIREMRPKGKLRQVIKDLIEVKGAYIIVSSQGSTSDSALTARKTAMKEALADYPNGSNLKVDFFDRERIATWVRSHPSLVLWVREKVGRPLQGWISYGNWSNSPKGVEESFIIDEQIRIYNNASIREDGFSAIEAIEEIRTKLQKPGSSVRLIGLSGVGKTRFVQALFDYRIGNVPLNQSQVFYTDMGKSPKPDPCNFAELVKALKIRAFIVVDNCPPDLHKRLTEVCSASGSLVSLITVEYDVRDDYPEETEVYRLEPASTDLIQKLISMRFTHVSEVDSRTIAEFAGGNARIAIALANTVRRGENLGNLRDYELFRRLFHQRNGEDRSLLRTAEVCSLVYSFNIQTEEGSNQELKLLSSIIGFSIQDIYLNVRELQRRELVQQRSNWRAVLPHAVANRLAASALENIPLEKILSVMVNGDSERLLNSFSRRLSYLHDSQEAIEISKRWLEEDGLLGKVPTLNEVGISMLINIAPISPELTLSVFERVTDYEDAKIFFSRQNRHYNQITRLLLSLAYDKNLFIRSTWLLCKFALTENNKENYNSIRDMLKNLFYLYLSGTHATPNQRLSIIKNLLETNSVEKIELGLSLLDASLETWHFHSTNSFDFGAHPRDYGYTPSSPMEIKEWFKLFIEYTVYLATSNLPAGQNAKIILAENFRGLWINAGMYNELEAASNILKKSLGYWKEGWLAVKTTLRFDQDEMKQEHLERLNILAKTLEPTTLLERAKLYALSQYKNALDIIDIHGTQEDDDTKDYYLEVEDITRSIGKEVSLHEELYMEILPELLSSKGARLFEFGEGLAEGCSIPQTLWVNTLAQVNLIDENIRNFQLIGGILRGFSKRDRNFAERLLDEAVSDELLGPIYPWLQTRISINSKGVARLKESLRKDISPIEQYGNLAYGKVHETINDEELCEILRLITQKPNGTFVTMDILHMRLHGKSKDNEISNALVLIGKELVSNIELNSSYNRRDKMDYELSNIIMKCFTGESGAESTKILCNRLISAFEKNEVNPRDYNKSLKFLAQVQPKIFLESFFDTEKIHKRVYETFREKVNPLSAIDDNIIITWCEGNPEIRYPIVASAIKPYKRNEGKLEWTKLALTFIDNAHDKVEVLKKLCSSLKPYSWSGSLANIMQERLGLVSILKEHNDPIVVDWAVEEEKLFEQDIFSMRDWELKLSRDRNETFE
jgi:hypothetical protein